MILDIATTLTAASKDWAAATALLHGAVRNAHCTDGIHFVGEDDAIAPLLYLSNACLDTDDQQRSLT